MIDKVFAILDVGSNSVRERVSCGDKVILRAMETTQLAKGMIGGKILAQESINRTLAGIKKLVEKAALLKTERFFAFATAAVRNADNAELFTSAFKNMFGFSLDVISGEQEAKLGLIGAFLGKDGAIIDIGGASTELAVGKGACVSAKSVQIGAVYVTDMFAKNYLDVYSFCKKSTECFSSLPKSEEYRAIGGTANTIAYIMCGLKEYNREKTNGQKITISQLKQLIASLYDSDSDELVKKFNIKPLRADVLPAGSVILLSAMEALSLSEITLAENDNLEGYYILNVKDKYL